MQPRVYVWPAASNNAIALLQTLGAAGNLTLNGSLASSSEGGTPSVIFYNYNRYVTLTSANDLSGVNFTITGTINSAPVSQTIAGPDNDTVATTVVFDTVTSISASAAATAVSAGTGTFGQTRWFESDYYLNVSNLSIQVVVTGTINYTFGTTLDNVNLITPTLFDPISGMTNATTSQLGNYLPATNFSTIVINSGTGSLTATFIQQGVKV